MALMRSTLTVSSMTLASRILGFVRDLVFARAFGAGPAMDAFFVAFRIPNFMRRLFAEGSFSLAFVPVLAEYREKQDRAALKQLIDSVTGTLAAVLLLVTGVGILLAPWVIRIFAPGFETGGEQHALASSMLRLTFPYLFFISLTALAGGILNSFNRFALPALTPVLLNIALIAAALGLAPRMAQPEMALAWGVLAPSGVGGSGPEIAATGRAVTEYASRLMNAAAGAIDAELSGFDALLDLLDDEDRSARVVAQARGSIGLALELASEEGGEIEPVEAWNAALARVPTPGAPGRAACNALAKLHDSVDMADVDADGTLALILQHHPERAWHYWAAWKRELPFDAARAERLLRDTVGLSQGLLREWAEEAPEQLAATVRRWEPAEPHSERFRVVAQWLDPKATDPGLRAALAL